MPALAPLPATAQAVVELEPLVIPGALVPLATDPEGASVTTLGRAELQAPGTPPRLAEQLATLPGFTLTTQGPFGDLAATPRIRGLDGRYIGVLIDGIPVSDPSGSQVQFDFGRMLGAGLGQVEVLRGPQSANWGGSAVAGVISLSTLAGIEEGLHQSVSIEAGTYRTATLSYGLTQKDARMELAFNLSHFRTDGFSAFADGSERDGGEATRLSFSGRYALNDAVSLGGAFFVQRTRHDYDGYPPPSYEFTDTDAEGTRREHGARLFAEFALGDSQQLFEVAAYRTRRETTDDFGFSEFSGRRLKLGWRGTTPVGEALTLAYGADWTREHAKTSALGAGGKDSDVTGAWVQAVWASSSEFELAASARHDYNSDFGHFNTGKLALAWHPTPDSTLRAALGSGFRAPSIDERYGFYPDFGLSGNPDLSPERSRSFELGWDQEFAGGATLSATLFRLETQDRIALTDDWSTLENKSGKSVSKGLELGAKVPLGERFTLGLAYTYTDARDPAGTRIAQVPRHDVVLDLDAQLGARLSGGLQLHHVADRPMDMAFPPKAMGDYTVASARLAYALSDSTEAWLRIENLTDAKYQTTRDFGTPGRALYLGLRAKF